MPPYYSSDVLRIGGELCEGENEYTHFSALRKRLFSTYCHGLPIYEFGCGNGHNLRSGDKGFDWSPHAVQKLKAKGFEAEVFNMYDPAPMHIPGVALTVHAMEQLGTQFGPFLQFLLEAKPKIVIHIEPILELYEDNLLDYLAVQYHWKRGYLEGYLPALKRAGVEILECKRSFFGSLFHEAYSVIVWKT